MRSAGSYLAYVLNMSHGGATEGSIRIESEDGRLRRGVRCPRAPRAPPHSPDDELQRRHDERRRNRRDFRARVADDDTASQSARIGATREARAPRPEPALRDRSAPARSRARMARMVLQKSLLTDEVRHGNEAQDCEEVREESRREAHIG